VKGGVALVLGMLTAAVVAGLSTIVVMPPEAGAAFPGESGKIVFESERDGDGEVYSMNGDGTGQTNLTNSPETSDVQPAVSAGGDRVAFKREDPRTCETGIYIMNTDGTGQTRLTSGCFANRYDSSPSWSPDGDTLTFVENILGGSSVWGSEISTINADGTGRRALGASGSGPVFSPDGTKIAYAKNYDGRDGIYIMNADGTEQTNLTPEEPSNATYRWDPAWSPDGEKVAFQVEGGVGVVNADGTGESKIINRGRNPAWSPDGERIVFETDQGLPADSADPGSEIWTMNADGTGQTRLTTTERNAAPDWSAVPGTSTPVLPPPTTAITSGPTAGSTSSGRSATFEFGSDTEGSSFECRLDAGPLVGCSSPRRLTSLISGKHTFQVMATDEAGRTDFTPASRAWTVGPPNRTPVARDDAFSAPKNRIITVRRPGILRNDRDPDDDRLAARVVTRTAHGRLDLESNGSFAYKPRRGYRGHDRFVYKVSDGKGGSDTARVIIRIGLGA
jgi:dipeptidyl aminopeptidase/acylaminoacyl peptidase